MVWRSFGATILNLSNHRLTFQSQECSGTITHHPAAVIEPMSATFCRVESGWLDIGSSLTLNYLTVTKQQLQFSWYRDYFGFSDSQITGLPEYSAGQTPPSEQVLSVTHIKKGDGNHMSVNYIVYPTPSISQRPLITSSQPVPANPLGDCDLVLAVSEQAINQQLANLCLLGLINQQWSYENEFGGFTATIKPPVVAITESTQRTQLLRCQIDFQQGTFTYQQKAYDMAGWSYVFDVAYSSISFSNSSENIQLHVPSKLIPAVQTSVEKLTAGSSIPNSEFTIQQLFLDMANGGNYDRVNSHLPLDSQSSFVFLLLLGSYVSTLNLKEHPYVLSYPVTVSGAPATSQLPKIYPSDLRIYPLFDPDPQKRSLNYLMMVNGRKFNGSGFNIHQPLLSGQKLALFVTYDLFNKHYLQNLVSQITNKLENEEYFGHLAFQLAQLPTTEGGNYSWASFQQNSDGKGRLNWQPLIAEPFGSTQFNACSASYGQGFILNLLQLTDPLHASKSLAFNFEMPLIKSLHETHGIDFYVDSCSSTWVAATQPSSNSLKVAIIIEPGTGGIVQVRVSSIEKGENLQLFTDMPAGVIESLNKWVEDADSEFLKQFKAKVAEQVELKFDTTFTNSVIFPLGSMFFYRNLSFLNQVSIDQRDIAISFVKDLAGDKSLPVGSSQNNVVILEASYD